LAGAEESVRRGFQEHFPGSRNVRIFRAPGRVNLIGEHTDYNEGFVLPIAIDLACYIASAPAPGERVRVVSETVQSVFGGSPDSILTFPRMHDWTDYVSGVAKQLHAAGFPIPAVDLYIHSTVPLGSGLSSSAALLVATALAFLNGRSMNKTDLARLCQRAERESVGTPSGIMDQYVSIHGEEDRAILLDCRNVTHRSVELPKDVVIIAVNSMVKHELGRSAYGQRVRECQEAVAQLRAAGRDISALRDVSSADLGPVTGVPLKRARHVTTEDERVIAFLSASEHGDLPEMGRLFVASHRSLQHDYEVSCEELDFLVDTAIGLPGVYGARMTGGGFGGCTVNLVARDSAESFAAGISRAYQKRLKVSPQIYICRPAAGASEIF
jgi:galactokinase